MKRIIIYITVIISLGIAGYLLVFNTTVSEVEVKTVTVKKGDITNMVTATGTVEPITQVDVGTQVSGTIKHIYVDYNSNVKTNQLIAELEKSTLQSLVSEAQANLDAAINNQTYQQKIFDRIDKLFENKVISQSDYDDALYNLDAAKITTDQGRSELTQAKTNLSYASIYAPIDGVVLSRDVDEGQTVAASLSTPTLFTIAQDLRQMQVEADVDEADIGQVKEGQRVSFTVDAYPEDVFGGFVTQIRLQPIEESNVITYTVIIKAENAEGKLMPGLTASITIYTEELKDVLTLEAKAFNFKPDEELMRNYRQQSGDNEKEAGPTPPFGEQEQKKEAVGPSFEMVWILKEDGSIYPGKVTVGSDDGVNVQVTDGLNENDQIVYAMSFIESNQVGQDSNASPFVTKPPGGGRR